MRSFHTQFAPGLLALLPVLGRGGLLACSLALAAALSGCGAMSAVVSMSKDLFSDAPKPVPPEWKSVVVTASEDANQNSPVAMDLVFVKDQAMLTALLATPSNKWFATRSDIRRSFGESVDVTSLELMPAQSFQLNGKALAANRALAAFVFADYPGPGEHRERLQMATSGYVVHLGAKGFKVAEVKVP
jgi:type VI secretion system protein